MRAVERGRREMMQTEQGDWYFRLPLTLSKEQYGEALRALVGAARKNPSGRTKRLQSLGKLAIYVLFGLPVFLLLLYIFRSNYLGAFFLTVAIFGLYYIALSLHFRWTDAWLGFTYNPVRHGQGTAIFAESDVRLIGPAHEQVWNWSLLRMLHTTPDLYVVEFAGMETLIIPRSAFSTAEEEADLSALIRGRLPVDG
jgi:hypothetical protein